MKIFKIDMIRVSVAVSFTDSPDDAKREAEKFLNCEIENSAKCEAFTVSQLRRSFVWVSPKAHRARVFHECFHLTFGILKEIRANAEDEELDAHLNELVVEKVLSLWEKSKGRPA